MEGATILVFALLAMFVPAHTSPGTPPVDTWCFVKEGCNQNSPDSGWNKGTCRHGRKQSPIDIVVDYNDMIGESLIDFSEARSNYDFTHFQMRNEGKHVELSGFRSASGGRPSFTWPDREDSIYTLQQIHVHWGPSNDNGSEHSIRGQKFAMEMHLIHYKSASGSGRAYKDISDAKKSGIPDALATIAIMFQADSSGSGSDTLLPIVKNLGRVVHRGQKVSVDEGLLKIGEILKVHTRALSYLGSTTTPTCDEVVVWLILPDPVNMKGDDLQVFRDTVHGVDGKILNTNRRRLQCGTGRLIGVVNFGQ